MEDAHVAVLDLRAHPGCPSDADTIARAFFGVRMLLNPQFPSPLHAPSRMGSAVTFHMPQRYAEGLAQQ